MKKLVICRKIRINALVSTKIKVDANVYFFFIGNEKNLKCYT